MRRTAAAPLLLEACLASPLRAEPSPFAAPYFFPPLVKANGSGLECRNTFGGGSSAHL